MILGGYLLALSRLGPVMDQVGRSHGGAQTFAHNLSIVALSAKAVRDL